MNIMLQYCWKTLNTRSIQQEHNQLSIYKTYLKNIHSPMNHITMAAKASHFEIVFHNITTRYYNKEYAMYVAHSIK